jgi:omega-6 fatty acid desaturase (delta-12 desaturase)
MRSVGDVARLLPPESRKQNALRSWLTFFRVFAMVGVTQCSLWVVPDGLAWWPLKLVLIFFAGLAFVGIFVLGHDCGHNSFSSRRWVNDVVGTLCHLPILNGFYAWREAHDFHHRRTQIRRVDPDWPELLYTKEEAATVPWPEKLAVRLGPGSPVGIFVGFWVGMLKRALFGLLIPQMPVRSAEKWKIYPHTFVSFVLAVILLREYYLLIGATKFVEMYVLPAIIGTSFGALLTFLHHTHEGSPVFDEAGYEAFEAQVGATWNVRFPRFMEWMWLDINIHLPHHVLPNLPWYQLRTATEIIRAARPELIKEKSWSWQTMRESWSSTTLEQVGDGKYRLRSSLNPE